MEKFNENGESYGWQEASAQSLEKRPTFLKELSLASNLSEIKAAVETFAVQDPNRSGDLTVVNFLEGGHRDNNEPDGSDDLESVMSALDDFERNPPGNYSEISEKIFNYAVCNRIAELFGITD